MRIRKISRTRLESNIDNAYCPRCDNFIACKPIPFGKTALCWICDKRTMTSILYAVLTNQAEVV
jgi:hypothetical protein